MYLPAYLSYSVGYYEFSASAAPLSETIASDMLTNPKKTNNIRDLLIMNTNFILLIINYTSIYILLIIKSYKVFAKILIKI